VNFVKFTLSSKDLSPKVLHLVSLFSSSFLVWMFPFFPSFLPSLSFRACLSSWVFWSCPSLLGCSEVASVMAEFSHCCWSCDRNSVRWLMLDIDVHPLPGAGEVSGDVMVGDQYHTYFCWRSMIMYMTIATVQTFYILFNLFLRVALPPFHPHWLVAVSLSDMKYL